MSCQTRAKQVAQNPASKSGITPAASQSATWKPRSSPNTFWRGYANPIRQALKQWRSQRDDQALLKMRTEITCLLADRLKVTKMPKANIAEALAQERAKLLIQAPKSLTVGERVERIAILDNTLALLKQQNYLSQAQYRAALVDGVQLEKVQAERSQAPVDWLPDRPVGLEAVSISQVDPTHHICTRFRVVDIAEPIASNTTSGAINPDYDQTYQPRRRNRVASQQQIQALAQQLDPATLLNPQARWDDGPPIVNQQGMVESGNGRVLALRQAAEHQPAVYQRYKDRLIEQASQLGFDREMIANFQYPILVRERLTDLTPTERLAFVAEANSSRVARMGSAEQARADAARLPASFLADFAVSDSDRSLTTVLRKRANQPVIQRFLKQFPQTERASLLDQQGRLSTDGVQRLERALFVYAFPNDAGERLTRLIYESGEAIDRIGAGLKSALPKLGQVEDRIQAGHLDPALRLGIDLATAVEKLRDLRQQGMRVNDYLRQHKLLPDLTAFQEQLLLQLDARRSSGRAVRDLLNAYAEAVLQTPSPKQDALWADLPKVTPTGAFRTALKNVGGAWVDLSQWSAAQQTISGFNLPATQIDGLDASQQQIGMLAGSHLFEPSLREG